MVTETYSLCKNCYGIVPAYVSHTNNGAHLIKNCSIHGMQEVELDPDPKFYQWILDSPKAQVKNRTGMTALNTTNRCNVRCPGCYALPDHSPDRSVESIVQEAAFATRPILGLMGAEATVREDLPELILALKNAHRKKILLYTNGIKLESKEYVDKLAETGLDKAVVSLHLPSYIGEKAFISKIKGLENLSNSTIELDHIAISLSGMDEVDAALDVIMALDYSRLKNGYLRLRAPSVIGGKRNHPCHLSELIAQVFSTCKNRGFAIEVMPFTNHMYAVLVKIEGRLVVVVRWPSVEEVDLIECQMCPTTALFVPEVGETQIIHQVLMTEYMRSGGALPPPPPINCPAVISGRTSHA